MAKMMNLEGNMVNVSNILGIGVISNEIPIPNQYGYPPPELWIY